MASYNILRALTTYKARSTPVEWRMQLESFGELGRARFTPRAQEAATLRTLLGTFLLFQKESFADLIAAYERLGGAEFSEDV